MRRGAQFQHGRGVEEVLNIDVNTFRTRVTVFNESFRAIEGLRIPTVAAVRGMAFGGGFELALSCDFIVASENVTFKCVEVSTGMLPIAGGCNACANVSAGVTPPGTPCWVSRFQARKLSRKRYGRLLAVVRWLGPRHRKRSRMSWRFNRPRRPLSPECSLDITALLGGDFLPLRACRRRSAQPDRLDGLRMSDAPYTERRQRFG